MPVTPSAARTVVRAANAAGKQVTATYPSVTGSGTTDITGTARFTQPGDPACDTVQLVGARMLNDQWALESGNVAANGRVVGSRTGLSSTELALWDLIYGPNLDRPVGIYGRRYELYPLPWRTATVTEQPRTETAGYSTGTVLVRLADITGIAQATANADPILGTTINNLGYRIPDPSWRGGTGLE